MRKRMRKKLATLALCAAAALAVTGCGGSEAEPARDPHAGLAGLTDAQQAKVDRAEERLIKKCMEERGFRYGLERQPTADERRSPGYVLDDLRWAREHGYGGRIQRTWDRARQHSPNIAYYRELPPKERLRWSDALYGAPDSASLSADLPAGGTVSIATEGCNAEALRGLYGDLKTWFRVDKTADNLSALYEPRIKQNKHFTAAVKSWSQCMSGKGHTYPDPPALRSRLPALTKGLNDTRAHAVEVRLAVAEAECARTSGLGKTARALEDTYRTELGEGRYRDLLRTHHRLQHTALARTEDVLDAHT